MRRIALTFVHGINNGPAEREQLPAQLKANLTKFGILDLFSIPNTTDHYVDVASWESVGDFFMDIAALQKAEWRENAIKTIANRILAMQEKIVEDSKPNGNLMPLHVVVMHSMGQPLGVSAVADLTAQKKILLPTIIISVGGPLGSRSPAFKTYLQWCTKRISWYRPASSLKVLDWLDLWNPDDPVCCDPVLNAFGSGYAACRGITKSVRFDWAGKPPINQPLAEHSSYFEDKMLYGQIAACVQNPKIQDKSFV